MKKTLCYKMPERTKRRLKVSPEDEKKLGDLRSAKAYVDNILKCSFPHELRLNSHIYSELAEQAMRKGDKFRAVYYEEFARKLDHALSKHRRKDLKIKHR